MGQFDWFAKIGATPQAVATLNDQPILFTILLIVLFSLIAQCVLLWYIHYATLKPEQKVKKDKKAPAKNFVGVLGDMSVDRENVSFAVRVEIVALRAAKALICWWHSIVEEAGLAELWQHVRPGVWWLKKGFR
ncbi:e85f0615-869d-481f-844f-feb1e952e7f8 [Thermothielavioides terrestris]|uniref:E85f0615-869d-481f-844f-feb1e952e7f8 n=1 Tax=Thermothielavioides terrestris TaxID=2587410 RepID=A0A3S4CCS9_9PEZI|nr:e85f0615-869d-481f-844f-feb1e952e7f8 [Thermothielavioides terrestris]